MRKKKYKFEIKKIIIYVTSRVNLQLPQKDSFNNIVSLESFNLIGSFFPLEQSIITQPSVVRERLILIPSSFVSPVASVLDC